MSYEAVYGFPCVEDPNDFTPDHECSSPEEVATWKLACQTFGKPEHQPNKGCYSQHGGDGQLVLHVARTSWGIGVNNVRICDECKEPFPRVHCWDCGADFCDACWPKHAESDEP